MHQKPVEAERGVCPDFLTQLLLPASEGMMKKMTRIVPTEKSLDFCLTTVGSMEPGGQDSQYKKNREKLRI